MLFRSFRNEHVEWVLAVRDFEVSPLGLLEGFRTHVFALASSLTTLGPEMSSPGLVDCVRNEEPDQFLASLDSEVSPPSLSASVRKEKVDLVLAILDLEESPPSLSESLRTVDCLAILDLEMISLSLSESFRLVQTYPSSIWSSSAEPKHSLEQWVGRAGMLF